MNSCGQMDRDTNNFEFILDLVSQCGSRWHMQDLVLSTCEITTDQNFHKEISKLFTDALQIHVQLMKCMGTQKLIQGMK